MTSASSAARDRVLVVGGTGHLGGKVVTELLSRGKTVSALVRPGTDPSLPRPGHHDVRRPAVLLRAVGLVVPQMKDLAAMVDWFATGNYVADTTRQAELFGPVPTAEGRDRALRREPRPQHQRRNRARAGQSLTATVAASAATDSCRMMG